MQRIYLLKGKVQHYSWGGFHFIPELVGFDHKEQKPYAEYWMGDHPSQSSTVIIDNKDVLLSHFIKEHGPQVLGAETCNKFGALPFLFKILDVRQMLSIQVHPSKEEARMGFEREDAAGIPITAPHRNYKDQNHKPEMMVALSDFWLLHGFKDEAALVEILSTVQEISFLKDIFFKGGFKHLFAYVMQLPEEEVNRRLHLLANRILPLYEQGALEKLSEDFWAARAIKSFCTGGKYDRGIFCIYLFNLLHLKKGEGVYQPAGMPHAYLEGQNVEIMANSDNVLRAGLTDKHIDVPELLKHTICKPTIPNIFGEHDSESFYPSNAAEFSLCGHRFSGKLSFNTKSAEIVLVAEGGITLKTDGETMMLGTGECVLVIAGTDVFAETNAPALLYRAGVGAA